jgi:hypothetical protein
MKNNIKLHFLTAIGACLLSFPLLAMDREERPEGGSMHHKPASAVSLAERSDASPISPSAAPVPVPSAAPPAAAPAALIGSDNSMGRALPSRVLTRSAKPVCVPFPSAAPLVVASAASVRRNKSIESLAPVPEDQSLRRIFIPVPKLKDLTKWVKWTELLALYTRTDTHVPSLPHEYRATIRIPVANIKDAHWMGIWKSYGVHAAKILPEFAFREDCPFACQGEELFCNLDNCQPAYGGYLRLQLRVMRVTGQGSKEVALPITFKSAKLVEDKILGWGFEVEDKDSAVALSSPPASASGAATGKK